ncbi:hypothetical protein M406DRAFT_270895 [Cryphonectria parasitica EP155]|uniref:Zn(2)-C6 fungal-type domain-containing protein n=1 Tax=Cryphonectria parasitica (strain ATCC 38755 / EP155) TaxID=660469 RepID=A0A9P4YA97_CRYP1|nr:uncharacterized protein M406DRAFT_270895 [Cryphonectria parasitica EP155]KAF3769899.1 hypothetical protein M406DRAFT_270895 [Cryphonectria parasitica EP155]
MVYCGKASLGCLSCRKRRIKCDKKQPECTQCVRLSRTCPGYRDQLSLMFRDETGKVEKRARASWGEKEVVNSGPEPASMPTPPSSVISSASPTTTITTAATSTTRTRRKDQTPSPALAPPALVNHLERLEPGPYRKMITPPSELGVSFYAHHYLLGYPDEVRNPKELSGLPWFDHPSAQATMAALGLAALGNRNGDRGMQHLSRVKYGEALRSTSEVLRDPVKNLDTAVRTTIMLALYQCVHMPHESHENTRVHLMGCLALLKTVFPIRSVVANGTRGILQLCYSLLYPCIQSGSPMPKRFFEPIRDAISTGFLPEDEQPAVSLIYILWRFTGLNAKVRWTAYTDGHASTTDLLQQVLAVDEALARWEASKPGKWAYRTCTGEEEREEGRARLSFPPDAVFRNAYHRYADIWTSRVWSHYRWARILTNQTLLELTALYPISAAAAGIEAGAAAAATATTTGDEMSSPARQTRRTIQQTIYRLAVDVCTSVPTHYKHPSLTWAHLDAIQTHGGAGAGAVGIPHLMFHLQTAACAPGVPLEVWRWAVAIMDTAWQDLGMLHARSLAEVSRNHRAMADGGGRP